METPEFIKKIDWSELRNQKNLLLGTINNNAVSPIHKEALEGILALIDATQDYAVDVMGMSSADVFDFEQEDVKEGYTGIDTMSEEKISVQELLDFVNNEDNHTEGELGNSCIDVQTIVHHFSKPQPNNPTNTKDMYLCPICNSDNVQGKYWVGLNDMKVDDCVDDGGDESEFCMDCENTFVISYPIPLLSSAHVIGFQVSGKKGTGLDGQIHPDMDASFCVYNLSWCKKRITSDNDWELLTIWHGDIEEPTMMFTSNPRL